ncbi:MAG: hypothetical protein JNK25_07850 [Phycisphaerae bacterium]|nr:hypothetical protein [Phycisphaerae bacterium]
MLTALIPVVASAASFFASPIGAEGACGDGCTCPPDCCPQGCCPCPPDGCPPGCCTGGSCCGS